MEKISETAARLEPAASLAVYDAETGRILRIHHFAAMPGAELPPEAQLREMTLKQTAAGLHRDMMTMKVVEIDARAIKPKTGYRVSPGTGALVELEERAAR